VPFLATLADLRPLVRSQAAVQRIRFIEDSDLNPWIIAAWVRLYSAYVTGGDPYFEKEADVVVATAGKVDLPADLMHLRRVDYVVGGRLDELDDLDVHEVALELSGPTPMSGRARGYRLRSNEIQLPLAAVGQSYRLVYAPTPTVPTDDTTAMDFVTIHGREWVVLDASIAVLSKQREDTTSLVGRANVIMRDDIKIRTRKRTLTRHKIVADLQSQAFEDPYLSGRVWWPWVR